jgi:hypothetical protein
MTIVRFFAAERVGPSAPAVCWGNHNNIALRPATNRLRIPVTGMPRSLPVATRKRITGGKIGGESNMFVPFVTTAHNSKSSNFTIARINVPDETTRTLEMQLYVTKKMPVPRDRKDRRCGLSSLRSSGTVYFRRTPETFL